MTDNVPFRLRVLRAITETLKAITPDNGYATDLSDFAADGLTRQRVFRGRDWFGDDDPLPMISILEPPVPVDPPPAPPETTARTATWDLLVQGFVPDDPANPTDPAYHLVADVMAALVKQKARRRNATIRTPDLFGLGGFSDATNAVTGLQIGSPIVRPADDISAKAYFWLPITLTLVEDIAHPFS